MSKAADAQFLHAIVSTPFGHFFHTGWMRLCRWVSQVLYILSAQEQNSPAIQNAIHPLSFRSIHLLKRVNLKNVEYSMDVEKRKERPGSSSRVVAQHSCHTGLEPTSAYNLDPIVELLCPPSLECSTVPPLHGFHACPWLLDHRMLPDYYIQHLEW